MGKQEKRFVVSDLGFGYAVHDTRVPQEYAFPAGREMEHKSSNRLNSKRVAIFATLEEAIRCAQDLERGSGREAG